MNTLRILLFAVLPVVAAAAAHAAEWPQRPITFVVGFSASSGVSILAREITQRLSPRLGQPVILEEKSGAAGTIASAFVARSAPEGYVFGVLSNSTVIANLIQPKLPYNQAKDFAAVTQIAGAPLVVTISKSVPATNLREFIAVLKANPGKYAYGSSGVGSSPHLAGEMFKKAAGVDLVHVPYRGSAPMVLALRTGEVAMTFDIYGNVKPHADTGDVRIVAVASASRSSATGDTPPVTSAVPGLEIPYWMGVYTRAGTPPVIVNRMSEEIAAILREPDMIERVRKLGLEVATAGPASFQKTWANEAEKFAPLVKELDLKPTD